MTITAILIMLALFVALMIAVNEATFANYWETAILDHIMMGTAYSQESNIWVALWVGDPGEAGAGGAEPTGNNYARVSTSGSDWDAAVSGAPSYVDNTNDITFNVASGSWGTVDYVALCDAVSGGNVLASGALSASKTISANDQPYFPAGDLDVTLD